MPRLGCEHRLTLTAYQIKSPIILSRFCGPLKYQCLSPAKTNHIRIPRGYGFWQGAWFLKTPISQIPGSWLHHQSAVSPWEIASVAWFCFFKGNMKQIIVHVSWERCEDFMIELLWRASHFAWHTHTVGIQKLAIVVIVVIFIIIIDQSLAKSLPFSFEPQGKNMNLTWNVQNCGKQGNGGVGRLMALHRKRLRYLTGRSFLQADGVFSCEQLVWEHCYLLYSQLVWWTTARGNANTSGLAGDTACKASITPAHVLLAMLKGRKML